MVILIREGGTLLKNALTKTVMTDRTKGVFSAFEGSVSQNNEEQKERE
jgi:hypothetical protein